MANLKKLNESIEELEENANKIKHLRRTLDELQYIMDHTKTLNIKQDKLKDDIQVIQNNVIEFLDKQNIINNSMRKEYETLSEEFAKLNKTQKSLNDDIVSSVKDISTENSKLYMDQRKHFDNQLDLNSSDLKNHNEKQKQDIEEKVDLKAQNLSREVNEKVDQQRKGITINRVLIMITLLVGISNIVIHYI